MRELLSTATRVTSGLGTAIILLTAATAQQAPWYGGASTGTAYPNLSTPVTASATGTNTALTATLPGVAGKTTFICGFALTSAGATGANNGLATVTGTINGTLNFAYEHPGTGQGELIVPFRPCIPANAANTAIAVNMPAGGAGDLAAVTAWGYQSGT